MANASNPPALATISHSWGAASPNSAHGVVNSHGSGFHDGPSVVTRSRWSVSRPQMIHAHGSYVGWSGPSSESAATARQPSTSSRHGRTRAGVAAGGDAGAAAATVIAAPAPPVLTERPPRPGRPLRPASPTPRGRDRAPRAVRPQR